MSISKLIPRKDSHFISKTHCEVCGNCIENDINTVVEYVVPGLCMQCLDHYYSILRELPSFDDETIRTSMKLIHFKRSLPENLKPKFKKFITLLTNGSKKAARYSDMVASGQMSSVHMLKLL